MGFFVAAPPDSQETGHLEEHCLKPPFDIAADLDTPVSAYLKLKPFRPRFLLESVEGGERLARYSFIGFGDCLEVRLDERGLTVAGQTTAAPATQRELLDALRAALAKAPQPSPADSRRAAARRAGRRRRLRSGPALRAPAAACAAQRTHARSPLPRAALVAGFRSPDARRRAAARGQRSRIGSRCART